MTFRPGRRLIQAVSGLAVVSLLAFKWPAILWVCAVAALALAIATWHDAQRARQIGAGISIRRTMPVIAGRDRPFGVRLRVDNGSPHTLAAELRDVRPDACIPLLEMQSLVIPANGSAEIQWIVQIPRRGQHRFGGVWIRVAGPLSLAESQCQLPSFGDIRILPEQFASRDELQKDFGAAALLLDQLVKTRQLGHGTEFVALDEYRLGDDPRRIDWRATARHQFPVVRRHQVERHQDVLIMIDSGRLMGAMTDRGSKLDCAIDSALNLARVALRSGDRCGIGVFDSSLRGFLAPVAGPQALMRISECVYDLQTNWLETDFSRMFAEVQRKQSKRCFLIVLSDLGDAETSRSHCAALRRLSRQHLVLFVALRTPQLQSTIAQPVQSIQQAAEQVVAHGLLRDRGRALHSLRHGGIQVLDVEPKGLTLPLINKFVEMRKRNQL